jgi:hypothetical protein
MVQKDLYAKVSKSTLLGWKDDPVSMVPTLKWLMEHKSAGVVVQGPGGGGQQRPGGVPGETDLGCDDRILCSADNGCRLVVLPSLLHRKLLGVTLNCKHSENWSTLALIISLCSKLLPGGSKLVAVYSRGNHHPPARNLA